MVQNVLMSYSISVAEHENEDWIDGRKTEVIVAFLDRLYTAKRKVERRIAILGGQDEIVMLKFLYMGEARLTSTQANDCRTR